jgi:hypothetical protein
MSDYRVATKGYAAFKAGDYDKTGEYLASGTEKLLEKMCESFGTELLQAYVNPLNGPKLVRQSEPAVVSHPSGKKRVLQFQYTRFPAFQSNRAIDVYNENRARMKSKRKISSESVWKEIGAQHEEVDAFEAVTNEKYIKHLELHRWPKGLYFAVYDVENEQGLAERLKPFLIHEHVEFEGKLPRIHITFDIEPYFVTGDSYREPTKDVYDTLAIDFPQIAEEHRACERAALSLHPLNSLIVPEKAFQHNPRTLTQRHEIHSEVPRKLTMGLIAAYLRKFCSDKDFY